MEARIHSDRPLRNQRAVILGGSTGIGLATAVALRELGAEVVVASRSADKLAIAQAAIGPGTVTLSVDAGNRSALERLFRMHGPLSHLVISIGGSSATGAFAELDEARLQMGFEHKFWASVRVLQAALPHLDPHGSVTFVTGAAARVAMPGMSGVAAVNGALEAMIGPLARELAPIRVNAVSPGLVDTPFWDGLAPDQRDALFDDMARSLPVGRTGSPADIAAAIGLLVCNGFMTGTVLPCDGGLGLR